MLDGGNDSRVVVRMQDGIDSRCIIDHAFRTDSVNLPDRLAGKGKAGSAVRTQAVLIDYAGNPAGNLSEAVEQLVLGQLKLLALGDIEGGGDDQRFVRDAHRLLRPALREGVGAGECEGAGEEGGDQAFHHGEVLEEAMPGPGKGGADRRGGDWSRVRLEACELATGEHPGNLLLLEEAIAAFEQHDAEGAEVVRLRFFAGLSVDETAEVLAIAPRTVDRHWKYARTGLFERLKEGNGV